MLKRGTNMAVIELKNVSKSYGGHKVVDSVNLTLNEGEIYGLIGRNGAGKTTLIRMLLGLATPDEGEILINGMSSYAALRDAREKIGAIVDHPAYSPYLSAFENMKVAALNIGIKDNEALKEQLRYVELNPDDKLPAKNFSLGMKQRLAIAMALLGDPSVLVLDEPVNGLDPTGIYEMRELINKLNREKKVAVLISSHLLAELGKMANSYGIMERGKLIRELRGDELATLARPFIKVVVGDMKKAVNVLVDNFKSNEFEILPYNTLAIYDLEKGVGETAALFTNAGIPVVSISQAEGDLEAAFIAMMGGVHNEQ